MDAGKLFIIQKFIGQQDVLFKIPVYQRNYDWSQTHVRRLLDDVKTIIETGKKHFLGTIVHMADSSKLLGGVSEYVIIDGQQRLTTMMILLNALADVAKENGDTDVETKINNQYLHNMYCTNNELKVKLKPIKSDNEQFVYMLNKQYSEMNKEGHIYINYDLCKTELSRWTKNGITVQQVLDALALLEIVEITLDKGQDDPQIIFESINSTGLELSSSDLIRNFLLMNAENQDFLYENYWLYIENKLKEKQDYKNLNNFFMQYILYKTNKSVAERDLYESFVNYYKDQKFSQQTILEDLKYYSDIFAVFIGKDDDDYSEDVKKSLANLRALKQTTCYPFMFSVFHDRRQHLITEETLEQTLKLLNIYLLRRIVCGVPSHSLRGLFIGLYKRIFKKQSNKNKYYESINKFLFTLNTMDVMPTEEEFKDALLSISIYKNNALCNFLLFDIENSNRIKDRLNPDNHWSIEHVMPQHLGRGWEHITEEEHEKFVHRLGNLTLVTQEGNSEMSNSPFEAKKEIFNLSRANYLNEDIKDKTTWEISDIINRGQRLAKKVLERYKLTEHLDEDIQFEDYDIWTLNEEPKAVTGRYIYGYRYNNRQYKVDSFSDLFKEIVHKLNEEYPDVFSKLPANQDCPFIIDHQDDDKTWEVQDGVWVRSGYAAHTVMQYITKMYNWCGKDKSTFSLLLVVKPSEDE